MRCKKSKLLGRLSNDGRLREMNSLLEELYQLLVSDLGSVVYHLILAFSCAGALQSSLLSGSRKETTSQRRLLVGLSILLGLQVFHFILSGLAWQGVLNASLWLPPLDRTITLLSLVVLLWLWVFPSHTSFGDIASLLILFFVGASMLLGSLWWFNQPGGTSFNGSWVDFAVNLLALGLLFLGSLAMFIRKPPLFAIGLAMLALLSLGHLAHLVIPISAGDFNGLVRFAQMAAFPFLFALAQRTSIPTLTTEIKPAEQAETLVRPTQNVPAIIEQQAWQWVSKVVSQDDFDEACQSIVKALAQAGQSDISLLVSAADADGRVILRCGYDQRRQKFLEGLAVESKGLPQLASAFRQGKPRRLAAASNSPDIAYWAGALSLEKTGNIFYAPMHGGAGLQAFCAVLLNPSTDKDWNTEEQFFLSTLANILIQSLSRSQDVDLLRRERDEIRQETHASDDQLRVVVEERDRLTNQLSLIQEEAARGKERIATLQSLLTAQTTSHAEAESAAQLNIQKLNQELEDLRLELQQVAQKPAEPSASLEGELNKALEEVISLREKVAEADKKIAALKSPSADLPISSAQIEQIVSIAQDLRQPLSSVVGYSDFLLSESVGILGAQQRKYLERIKSSTERMSRLIDNLVQATSTESNPTNVEMAPVEMGQIINEAIYEADAHLQYKRLNLQVNLPDQPLNLLTDPHALKRILAQLVRNAGLVTPSGGSVLVTAKYEKTEDEQGYILVQISDQGGGIPPQEIPHLFSPRSSEVHISGISDDGIDFIAIKSLIEVLGGRTWVDSEPEQGTTFSVLLPTSPSTAGDEPGLRMLA